MSSERAEMTSTKAQTPGTRERIVETSAELFRKQGYTATGVKQIVNAAKAPFGSVYHFFPGGKEQLGAEAITVSGAIYEQLIPAVLDPAPDPVTGVRDFFAGAAEHVRETDYADACPIATVALEVSSTSEPMREACAQVFELDRDGCAPVPRCGDRPRTSARADGRDAGRARGRVRPRPRVAKHRPAGDCRRGHGGIRTGCAGGARPGRQTPAQGPLALRRCLSHSTFTIRDLASTVPSRPTRNAW